MFADFSFANSGNEGQAAECVSRPGGETGDETTTTKCLHSQSRSAPDQPPSNSLRRCSAGCTPCHVDGGLSSLGILLSLFGRLGRTLASTILFLGLESLC